MQPIKSFYLFSKLFGLCPYPLDPTVPVNTRASYVKQLLPTYTVLLLYSSCLVSIFWQSGNTSDISNAANWIQVSVQTSVTGAPADPLTARWACMFPTGTGAQEINFIKRDIKRYFDEGGGFAAGDGGFAPGTESLKLEQMGSFVRYDQSPKTCSKFEERKLR